MTIKLTSPRRPANGIKRTVWASRQRRVFKRGRADIQSWRTNNKQSVCLVPTGKRLDRQTDCWPSHSLICSDAGYLSCYFAILYGLSCPARCDWISWQLLSGDQMCPDVLPSIHHRRVMAAPPTSRLIQPGVVKRVFFLNPQPKKRKENNRGWCFGLLVIFSLSSFSL